MTKPFVFTTLALACIFPISAQQTTPSICQASRPPAIDADMAMRLGEDAEKAEHYPEALCWYRLSATLGSADAQTNIGFLYYWGRGVPQSYPEALRRFKIAADKGDSLAFMNVANMYEAGKGVPKNHAMAVHWQQLAQQQAAAEAAPREQPRRTAAASLLDALVNGLSKPPSEEEMQEEADRIRRMNAESEVEQYNLKLREEREAQEKKQEPQ